MRRFSTLGAGLVFTVAALFIFGNFTGCGQKDAQHEEQADEHAGHDHANEDADEQADAHAGHDHGEEGHGAADMSLEDIEKARCEHNMPAYQCDACRYEVGVVKVQPSILNGSKAGEGGLIDTELVGERPLTTTLAVTGEVQLNENAAVHISPRIPGIIDRVHVDIGARVKKGDLLFKITSVELGKTLSDYERSRTMTELSGKNFEREKLLFERKISSEQDMIEAQMTYEQHKTELEAAKQALSVFGLTAEDLSAITKQRGGSNAGSLPVRASIDGTIIQKHAVVGELVETGKDVMLLADLRSVWIWADIYEKDLPQLLSAEREGPIPVQIFVSAFPDQAFPGSIDYIGATMDESTRTVKVRATVLNPDGQLRPGMFCDIHIGLHGEETVLAIPKAALLSDEGESFVFSHWKEDYYVRRSVSAGREFFDLVEVLAGLEPGVRIVTEGAFLLKSDILREKMGAGCAD
jgi:cobalt-zinc-cadmium efflux system membrane fusion protein